MRVHGDEGIASANGFDNRQQPPERGVVERHGGKAEHRDDVQADDQRAGFFPGRNVKRAPDPLRRRHGRQQNDDGGAAEPVHDDEDPQHGVRERQSGG